jgi:hypothetical protein
LLHLAWCLWIIRAYSVAISLNFILKAILYFILYSTLFCSVYHSRSYLYLLYDYSSNCIVFIIIDRNYKWMNAYSVIDVWELPCMRTIICITSLRSSRESLPHQMPEPAFNSLWKVICPQ